MNNKLLKELEKMNISDLRFICQSVHIKYTKNSNKKQLILYLLKPLKILKKYRMNMDDPYHNQSPMDSKFNDFYNRYAQEYLGKKDLTIKEIKELWEGDTPLITGEINWRDQLTNEIKINKEKNKK